MQACSRCLKSCASWPRNLATTSSKLCTRLVSFWPLSAAAVAEIHGTAQHTTQQVLSQDQCLSASFCMSAQLHLSVLHVIRLSCQTLHVSWAAPIGHDSCACHTTKPEVRSQCACSKSAGLHPNSVCQLGCTYQIPHGTQLTLSGEDMPGQMQSPGYKNASRY